MVRNPIFLLNKDSEGGVRFHHSYVYGGWDGSFTLLKDVFQIRTICLLAQSDVRGEVWSDNKYEPDGEIKRKREDLVGEQTLQREDKDISYAKLTHNVARDSGGCRPSHTQRGFWDGRVRGSGGWAMRESRSSSAASHADWSLSLWFHWSRTSAHPTRHKADLGFRLISLQNSNQQMRGKKNKGREWKKIRGRSHGRPHHAKAVAHRGRCNVTKLASKR